MSVASADLAEPLDEYRQLLRNLAVRRGLAAEADDIAQEAIARFLARRDQLDLGRDPVPWLVRVTTNLCHDARRARARMVVTGDEELAELATRTVPSALDEVIDRENERVLTAAFALLSETDRAALRLRYVHEAAYAAVAEELGVTVNTARQQVFRARHRFIAALHAVRDQVRLALLPVAVRLRARRTGVVPADFAGITASFAAQVAVPLALLGALGGGSAGSPATQTLRAAAQERVSTAVAPARLATGRSAPVPTNLGHGTGRESDGLPLVSEHDTRIGPVRSQGRTSNPEGRKVLCDYVKCPWDQEQPRDPVLWRSPPLPTLVGPPR